MLTNMLLYFHIETCIKILIHVSHLKSEKKTELDDLECSKTSAQMNSYARIHVFVFACPNKQKYTSLLIINEIIENF